MVTWKTPADTVPLNTVLIVSGELPSVEVWETLFGRKNCIVVSESTIPDAVQTARLVHPSLMLIDMNLSGSERSTLLAGLRTASRGPILMVITTDTVDEVIEASHEGVDECLVRPVNPSVLVVKAMAWLTQNRRAEQAPAWLNAAR